jgi:hypothetical protein
MNTLMLVVLAVVLLCYCGGKYCPKVLSSNKEMLLGVLVGMALCSFTGLRLEGFESEEECRQACTGNEQDECNRFWSSTDTCANLRGADAARNNTEDAAQAGSMFSGGGGGQPGPMARINLATAAGNNTEGAAQAGSMFSGPDIPSTN